MQNHLIQKIIYSQKNKVYRIFYGLKKKNKNQQDFRFFQSKNMDFLKTSFMTCKRAYQKSDKFRYDPNTFNTQVQIFPISYFLFPISYFTKNLMKLIKKFKGNVLCIKKFSLNLLVQYRELEILCKSSTKLMLTIILPLKIFTTSHFSISNR